MSRAKHIVKIMDDLGGGAPAGGASSGGSGPSGGAPAGGSAANTSSVANLGVIPMGPLHKNPLQGQPQVPGKKKTKKRKPEDHEHTFSITESTGRGRTDEVDGHSHRIIGHEVQFAGEDGHTHDIDMPEGWTTFDDFLKQNPEILEGLEPKDKEFHKAILEGRN